MLSRRGRRAGSRVERAERERRERALAHLERRRGAARRGRTGSRAGAAAGLLASLAAGVLLGEPLLAATVRLVAGDAPRVEAIHVRGASRLSAEEVARACGVVPGAALGEVEPDAVAARVAEHDWIAHARAARLPTGVLVVDVSERVPLAVLETDDPAARFLVDASGRPFAPVPAQGGFEALPRLFPAESLAPRAPHPELEEALALLARLPEHGLAAPREISVAAAGDPEGLALRWRGLDLQVVLGRAVSDARLARLGRVLASGRAELLAAAALDLRFQDQALLREEPAPEG